MMALATFAAAPDIIAASVPAAHWPALRAAAQRLGIRLHYLAIEGNVLATLPAGEEVRLRAAYAVGLAGAEVHPTLGARLAVRLPAPDAARWRAAARRCGVALGLVRVGPEHASLECSPAEAVALAGEVARAAGEQARGRARIEATGTPKR